LLAVAVTIAVGLSLYLLGIGQLREAAEYERWRSRLQYDSAWSNFKVASVVAAPSVALLLAVVVRGLRRAYSATQEAEPPAAPTAP
jgi:hypothetical protein